MVFFFGDNDPFRDMDRLLQSLTRFWSDDTQRIIGSGGQLSRFPVSSASALIAPRTMRLDVNETDKDWVIQADLPGIKKEDVNVTLEKNILTISAERKNEFEEKSATRHMFERHFGQVSRQLMVPESLNPEKREAKFENGVLSLKFGKKEADQPKKITIM